MKQQALKCARYNQLDAFNKWKMYALSKVDERQQAALAEMEARNKEFNDYVKQVKRVNMGRVFGIL